MYGDLKNETQNAEGHEIFLDTFFLTLQEDLFPSQWSRSSTLTKLIS